MKNICIILGTRPEAIKLIPIYLELKKHQDINVQLVSTGQHKSMLKQIFDFFEIEADVEFDIMKENQTLVELTSKLFLAIGDYFDKNSFDFVLVQGDTTTAYVASVVSFYYKYSIAHVEAGLRTYNKYSPFPEEINRKMIGVVADIHFTPTDTASENLHKENINANVINVGNSVIDSLILAKNKIYQNEDIYKKYFDFLDENRKIVLVTGHRRESFGKGFDNITDAIIEIANSYENIQIVYPVHLNPNVKDIVYKKLQNFKNIKLIDPLPYDRLIYLMSKSWIILTDSGGIHEEAPSFNIPLIVMRDTTERAEGIEAGCSILAGTQKDSIIDAFNKIANNQDIYKSMSNVSNPYGDGKTSLKIVEYLLGYKATE